MVSVLGGRSRVRCCALERSGVGVVLGGPDWQVLERPVPHRVLVGGGELVPHRGQSFALECRWQPALPGSGADVGTLSDPVPMVHFMSGPCWSRSACRSLVAAERARWLQFLAPARLLRCWCDFNVDRLRMFQSGEPKKFAGEVQISGISISRAQLHRLSDHPNVL